MKSDFKSIIDTVFGDVFGRENTLSLSEAIEKFAIDIPRPRELTCMISGKKTWGHASKNEKVASIESIFEQFKKNEWMQEKKPLNTINDILSLWEKVNYITSEKYINSQNIFESDGVYNSSMVYGSNSIFDSKNVIASYKLTDCSNMFASRDSQSCTYGIRMKESVYSSSSFEVSWSNKISKSMYIHDSSDLYECLFCSHIRSKKYCIANMQFEKDEYFKLKEQVVDWIFI